MSATHTPLTLYQKLYQQNTITKIDADHVLLYVDFHVLNEYTSPQAFSGLRAKGRRVWRPKSNLAIVDHVNSTRDLELSHMRDAQAAEQIRYLRKNCDEFGIELFDLVDPRRGIEHVAVPEQGMVRPGMVIVCGDSHTTTYGAFGALGFGIGTSDVEHALASQSLVYKPLKDFRVDVHGHLPQGVTAKDLVMNVIGIVGASGATGYAVEFCGSGISALSMESRMTICNMAMECGARAAIIAPDQTTIDYMRQKPRSPSEEILGDWRNYWGHHYTDADAEFDRSIGVDAAKIAPFVTWGTSPDQVVPITGRVPFPEQVENDQSHDAALRALAYMDLVPGTPIQQVTIDHAFIGSCTNSRIEDLRSAADVLRGRNVAPGVRAIVVPGSQSVKRQAEKEGLSSAFKAAGFEWRESGCSMCLAMNDDILPPGSRCASSTNRNFEGRQGRDARTHLMSPAMVAAAAIKGRLTDVRTLGSSA